MSKIMLFIEYYLIFFGMIGIFFLPFIILKSIADDFDELPKMRYHVTDEIIKHDGSFLSAVIKFDGIVYEAVADNVLENDFDSLNLSLAVSAKEKAGRLAFNNYLLRRKTEVNTTYDFENKFCQDLADKYLQRFNDKDYYENHFYINILLRYNESIDEAIEEIAYVVDAFIKKLNQHKPKVLKVYKNKQGVLCSEVFEFYHSLLNGEEPRDGFPTTKAQDLQGEREFDI